MSRRALATLLRIGAVLFSVFGAARSAGADESRAGGRNESGRTQAFVLESSVPVKVQDIDALSGTSSRSAALLASTSAWDTDYYVAMPTPDESPDELGGFVEIVGREDTVVEIRASERSTPGSTSTSTRPSSRRWRAKTGRTHLPSSRS